MIQCTNVDGGNLLDFHSIQNQLKHNGKTITSCSGSPHVGE